MNKLSAFLILTICTTNVNGMKYVFSTPDGTKTAKTIGRSYEPLPNSWVERFWPIPEDIQKNQNLAEINLLKADLEQTNAYQNYDPFLDDPKSLDVSFNNYKDAYFEYFYGDAYRNFRLAKLKRYIIADLVTFSSIILAAYGISLIYSWLSSKKAKSGDKKTNDEKDNPKQIIESNDESNASK